MKTTSLNQNLKQSSLTGLESSLNEKIEFDAKIYINTLFPGFSYSNEQNETVTPKKCILH